MRVLVVEDYPSLQKSIQKGLQKSGFEVDVAGDGITGLEHALSGTYDVLILDVMMPGIDGFELLTRLRQQDKRTPVLMLTARDTIEDRVKGLDSGADDYLIKPFAFEELLARVRAMVRRKYDDHSDEIKVGPLRLDTRARQAFIDDEEIVLTAKPYQLLEYLARRANRVVTRDDIFEHLYSMDSAVSGNVVEVQISTLRKKLSIPGKESLIQTRRGIGYILGEVH